MRAYIYQTLFIFVLSTLFLGCTVIGLLVGINNTIDEEQYDSSHQNLLVIDFNEEIKVETFQNDIFRGNFIGFSRLPFDEYKMLYLEQSKKNNSNIYIPQLGEKVSIGRSHMINHSTQRYKITKYDSLYFWGFALGGVLISDSTYENSKIIPFKSVKYFNSYKGFKMDLSKLKSEFILGNVPLATLLIIHTGEVEYKIMASDIKNITIEYSDANFLIGLGAGLAIDLLFLALTFDLEIHLGPPATK